MHYRNVYSKKVTPQSEPIPGSTQVENSAGGYVYQLDDWKRLDRFLVLGTEGGTYYVKESRLSRDNAEAVIRCLNLDGVRVVNRVVEISEAGRAPKNSPALFVLALAASLGDQMTRRTALKALTRVARIGTHLFEFCEYVQSLRGWGRGLKKAISEWYSSKSIDALIYQLIKYQQREGWSHRDLLRLCHVRPTSETYEIVYRWVTHGWESVGEEPHPDPFLSTIWAVERLKIAKDQQTAIRLIRDYRLPREVVPTEWLKDPEIWEMLLESMPMTAMIRNLATMTKVGLLTPGSNSEKHIIAQLENVDRLSKARVHPIALLSALKVYQQGHGERSDALWSPCSKVVDALDQAFYAAFKFVEPSNKRLCLALDISGSMTWYPIAGIPGLTPRIVSAALALVTANVEPSYEIVGFTSGERVSHLDITPTRRLDDVLTYIESLRAGGTDCALPMIWANQNHREFDGFVIYTDNETWAGDIHPSQALRKYRHDTGIGAKLISVGMTSTGFTVADPTDAGMLDVCGFDASTPSLITDFVKE